jgi:hypothetical protein
MSRHKKAHGARAATPPPVQGQNRPEHSRSQDRRLHLVTALLLTAEEFPGELGESFPEACAAVGVEPAARGYGLVLAQDEQGERWTQITSDASGVSSAQSIWNMGVECAYEPPDSSVVAVRPGWPVECVLGLAGLGEPHDPADVGGTALRPPRRGTPGRRRGMADIIDGELADMRGRSMEEYIEAHRQDAYDMGDTDPTPPPARLIDVRGRIPPDHPAHQAVERALAAAWSLAATTKPPPGSVRIRKASPGKARLVRATGDGWTLIGRTDGPVVLLADAIQGLPVDIEDSPRINELLAALTAAAGRAGR